MAPEREKLLRRIRTLVAEVEQLRAAGASEVRVQARRREIAGLKWRLADVVSHDPMR
jgi:hypothetical protein